ncbi:MAG: TerC family protein [Gammaproteobacteria bacterium]
MTEILSASEFIALLQVIIVDLLLAVDNTIVVGLVAASLPPEQRKKVVAVGIILATILRIVFALVASYLLLIVGLMIAGGLLLIWVGWKMLREMHKPVDHAEKFGNGPPPKTFRQAVWQVLLADVAMSLDNVLGVAGAAGEHTWILVFGLVLSVFLMGSISVWLANLLNRHRWLVYVGIGVVFMVALEMIWKGSMDFM